jgi:hypothetical protein
MALAGVAGAQPDRLGRWNRTGWQARHHRYRVGRRCGEAGHRLGAVLAIEVDSCSKGDRGHETRHGRFSCLLITRESLAPGTVNRLNALAMGEIDDTSVTAWPTGPVRALRLLGAGVVARFNEGFGTALASQTERPVVRAGRGARAGTVDPRPARLIAARLIARDHDSGQDHGHKGFGETRRMLVQAGDEATGPLGCRWLKGLAVAMLGCWGAGVLGCWGAEALRR